MGTQYSYPYSPLAGDSDIRLVRIKPGQLPQPISCEIYHASLKDNPVYRALSYTWDLDGDAGAQPPPASISCGEQTLQVTANLGSALKRLRDPDHEQTFWIDALSVDQSNDDERSRQVRMMHYIYSQAHEVVVWLGEEEPTDGMALDTIHQLRAYFQTCSDASDHLSHIWRSGGHDALPELQSPRWKALGKFVTRRWWFRLWVIQEVVMASKVVIMLGSRTEDWDLVASVFLRLRSSNVNVMVEGNGGHQGLQMFNLVSRIKEFRLEQGTLDLNALLAIGRRFESQNPRDRVFGLLGIMMDSVDPVPESDYQSSVEEVYTEAAIHCLTSNDPFAFLSLVEGRIVPGTELLPSWAPHWAHLSKVRNSFAEIGRHFAAMKGIKQSISLSEDRRKLITRGVLIDVVMNVGRSWVERTNWLGSVEEMADGGRALGLWFADSVPMISQNMSGQYNYTNQAYKEAYWRTLVCDTLFNGQQPSQEFGESYDAFHEVMQILYATDSEKANYDKDYLMGKAHLGNPFERALNSFLNRRAFGVTEMGYMGMFLEGTVKGDIVCGFAGAKTPFIIRQDVEGCYRLVGECYVHGLMHGEILQLPDFHDRLQDLSIL